jgi:AcrR family transcriptional regulator
MQRVAEAFGYTPMALYRYVPGKSQLVALMNDRAFGPPPPTTASPWRPAMERWARGLWQAYARHPWTLRVRTSSAPIGPNELAWFEACLAALSKTGLRHHEQVAMATFVSSSVRDLARISHELRPTTFGYGEVLEQILHGDRFPTLAAMLAAGSFDGSDEDGGSGVEPYLELGLEVLMDGIETHTRRRKRAAR